MPFPMRIQPINNLTDALEEPAKPAAKSRLKRLFERQFLRVTAQEKITAGGEEVPPAAAHFSRESSGEFEPSSVCLENMVQSFIEDEDKTAKCSRNRCNCFNGNGSDSSEDELDSFGDACEILKVYIMFILFFN